MKSALVSLIISLFKDTAYGETLSAVQWEKVVFVLRQTKLLASLYHLSVTNKHFHNYHEYAKQHMYSASIYADRQAQQVRYEGREIAAALGEQCIKAIFLKGAGYTLSGSQNGKGRIYSDIDVLVEKPTISIAQKALQKKGWHSKQLNDYDERYYRKWAHEVPPMVNIYRGTVIDLHHNIVPPVSGRAPDAKIFLDEAICGPDGLAFLSPPAAALHSCVHLFTNEDFSNGFRDILDIYLMVQENGDDESYWNKLLELAERSGFTLELFYCTEILTQMFDMNLPDKIRQILSKRHNNIKTQIFTRIVFRRALYPHHPLTFSLANHIANFIVYLRGHWIKMPFYILIMHLSVKSFYLIRDWLFGKYQFDKAGK